MKEHNTIETLRKQYYDAIKLLQDKDDIIEALPKPIYKSFFPIMSELIKQLKEDEEELRKMLSDEKQTSEMREYIKKDLEICMLKKEICIELYKQALEEETIEKTAEKKATKNIIFAKSESGNIYLQKDIKGIKEEYYDAILDLIEKIATGYREQNSEKAKAFTTVNSKLSGIHELKAFKIRVAYKILDQDTVYLLIARTKKDDNESLDREEVIKRANNTEKEYKRLKKEIKNKDKKKKLVEEHKQIKEQIEEFLKKNRRGRGQ